MIFSRTAASWSAAARQAGWLALEVGDLSGLTEMPAAIDRMEEALARA